MPATIEQPTHEALALTEQERAHLAQTLLQSLEPAAEMVLEEAWDDEAARRLERVRDGTAQGRPEDEVLQDLRARCRQ